MDTATIERLIEEAVPGATVVVKDTTGTNDHFEVEVVSEKFDGLSLLEQQTLVQTPLRAYMEPAGGPIHALTIKTHTPSSLEE